MKKMVFLSMLMVGAAFAETYAPAAWNLEERRKFAEQRFGIFIHWGIYAAYAQGEWYLYQGKLDESTYARAADGFCPSKFDAHEWVKAFKDAGAKYVTITSRHHDGFSLWPTKVDDGYNIANTPFKRDILGELATACREEGLQLNFYYSLMDWHRKDYPDGRDSSLVKVDGRRADYPSYKRFMMAQLKELLEGYHPGVIWFDGEWDHNGRDHLTGKLDPDLDWEFDDLYDFIHAHGALVANNNHLTCRDKEDIQLFERDLPGENATGLSAGQQVMRERPLEQCDVIQTGVWGYKIGERTFRTAEDVVAMVVRAAAKDSNLLMNIGPDASGRLPMEAMATLKRVGGWFSRNGESIYGTTPGGIGLGKDVVSTRKGNVVYLHFLTPGVEKFAFKLNGEVVSATGLADGTVISVERTASGDAVVTVRRSQGDLFDLVVKLIICS